LVIVRVSAIARLRAPPISEHYTRIIPHSSINAALRHGWKI
jgi:hypothetical protein